MPLTLRKKPRPLKTAVLRSSLAPAQAKRIALGYHRKLIKGAEGEKITKGIARMQKIGRFLLKKRLLKELSPAEKHFFEIVLRPAGAKAESYLVFSMRNAREMINYFVEKGNTFQEAKSETQRVLNSIVSKVGRYDKAYSRSHDALARPRKRGQKFHPGEEHIFSTSVFGLSLGYYQQLIERITA